MEQSTPKKNAGGRPRKFAEPSKPITVTLPDRILSMLNLVDPDRAQAITKATEAYLAPKGRKQPAVEVIDVAPGTSLIVVGPSVKLQSLPWLRMVEIAPARYLITIATGTPIETLEVGLSDLLDELKPDEVTDREILTELIRWIKTLRRGRNVSKAELLLVSTHQGK